MSSEGENAERILKKWRRERRNELVETPFKDAAYKLILAGRRRIYKR